MADISNITLPNEENYDIKDKAARNDIAINRTTLGTQCKNLLKNETGNTVMGGLTFTHNSDGSVTINGTSDGQYFYTLMSKDFENILGKKCILTGCPANGSNSTFGIYIRVSTNDYIYDSGAGVTFTTNKIIWINIVVRGGVTFDNVTFYPMLRYADITDSTYEPYKENIDERLIQNKSDIAVNKTTLGYQCKNLFKNTAVSQTAYGVTFTVNDDKSIIVDGTATRNIYFNIGEYYFEADKQYILNGCPSGGSGTKYFLAYSGMAGHQYDTGSGTTFSVSESVTKAMLLVIVSGQTVSNLTFYPMLRYADITDDTYEPYRPSLQEQINALTARISALEGT